MQKIINSGIKSILLHALWLNLIWEIAQMPLYDVFGMSPALHLLSVIIATIIDAVLIGLLFSLSLYLAKEKHRIITLILLGAATAIIIEFFAIYLGLWSYRPAMPIILGIGLSPLLQLTILTPLSYRLSKT